MQQLHKPTDRYTLVYWIKCNQLYKIEDSAARFFFENFHEFFKINYSVEHFEATVSLYLHGDLSIMNELLKLAQIFIKLYGMNWCQLFSGKNKFYRPFLWFTWFNSESLGKKRSRLSFYRLQMYEKLSKLQIHLVVLAAKASNFDVFSNCNFCIFITF